MQPLLRLRVMTGVVVTRVVTRLTALFSNVTCYPGKVFSTKGNTQTKLSYIPNDAAGMPASFFLLPGVRGREGSLSLLPAHPIPVSKHTYTKPFNRDFMQPKLRLLGMTLVVILLSLTSNLSFAQTTAPPTYAPGSEPTVTS